MIFEVKRYRRRLHLHDFLVADGKAVLLALIENIRKIRNEISELLHGAVGLLVVAELAGRYGVFLRILTAFGLREYMVDGHIIKLDFFATIRAMAIETIVNISSIHTLETVSYPHANRSARKAYGWTPSAKGTLSTKQAQVGCYIAIGSHAKTYTWTNTNLSRK